MKSVIVASENPVKIDAVRLGFERMFPEEDFHFQGVGVESGVSDQPMTDQMALNGALTRVQNAQLAVPQGDYWVGVEGGCEIHDGDMVAFAWIVIRSGSCQGSARTAQFRLPKEVQRLVESGLELGDADDKVFGRSNSKQKSGAVGLLTSDVVTRTTLYEQAIILALIPFKNPNLYSYR
ncbi:MAG: inosine/xanthosine triphosphatase [Brevefilum sp.]